MPRKSKPSYDREYYWRNRNRIRAQARQAYHSAGRRDRWMFRAHGLTPEGWAAAWEVQDGRCYLGGEELAGLDLRLIHVDHDHGHCPPGASCSVCRRGLACNSCNTAIGLVGDDAVRLRCMADALEAAQLAVEQRKAIAARQLTLED